MRFVFCWSVGACALALGVACSNDDATGDTRPTSTGGAGGASGVTQGTTTGTTSSTDTSSSTATTGVTSSATGSGGGGTGAATTSTGAGTGGSGTGGSGTGGSGTGGGSVDAGAGGSTADAGAPRKIGGGCKVDSECDVALGLHCDLSLPGGMCTKACMTDGECGVTTLTGQHANNVCVGQICYRGCSATVPCVATRNGYACIGSPNTYCGVARKDGGP